MVALLLFLIAVWVVLGIIGLVVKGLIWAFFLALVLVVLTLMASAFRLGRRRR